MSISRAGLMAGTTVVLVLMTAIEPRVALAQPQAGIGIKAGDTVTVGTGQGWVMAIGAMEIDINDDGSLQAPFGELTKKGK